MKDRGLSATTLGSESYGEASTRAVVPCLTVLCHGDLGRVGERALLSALWLRKPVLVSRGQTAFAHPGSTAARVLEDPFLSRTPLTIRAGEQPESTVLSAEESHFQVDGTPLEGTRVVDAEQVRRGVVIRLSSRIALLLHNTRNLGVTEVPGLLGQSDGVELLRRDIARLADVEIPVLVRGETGVGKELVAQALHRLGRRAARPCLAVNMATLSEGTAVSTLFGHRRGAFTGADRPHRGLFERARGGTLFLDEVGETPDAVQPMLLRVLEEQCISPLGAEREQEVDVRVVAATDAPLARAVERGNFRSALLHRLASYEIHVPPLRERRDDIPRLLVHFLRNELETLGRGDLLDEESGDARLALRSDDIIALVDHPFPGNVRELRNVARQLAIASHDAGRLDVERAMQRVQHAFGASQEPGEPADTPVANPPSEPRARISMSELMAALRDNAWSPERTAASLGIPKSTVHYLMRKSSLIRRATDISDEELRGAFEACGHDVDTTAARLQVSARALAMTLRRRGMLAR